MQAAECLFHVISELRYGTVVQDEDVYLVLLRADDDEVDEDEDEDRDEPEHDVTTAPDPYFLLWHSMQRLLDDQLIELGGDIETLGKKLDFMEEAELHMGDFKRGTDGLFLGVPYDSVTELGARYLAFLRAPDTEDLERYKA